MNSLSSARPASRSAACALASLIAARLLAASLLTVGSIATHAHATEPRVGATVPQPSWASPQSELHRLLAGSAPPSQWLPLVEQLYAAGRLHELASGVLAGAQGTGPGWRWETRLPDGTRLVLATDGLMLVAIGEGRVLEFSVRDLTVGGDLSAARSRNSTLFANRTAVEHITAASAGDLARKAPDLFPVYYFFAGPTREIVSSHLLPHPP